MPLFSGAASVAKHRNELIRCHIRHVDPVLWISGTLFGSQKFGHHWINLLLLTLVRGKLLLIL